MTLLTINITNSCNFNCYYCPIPTKFKVPIDTYRKDVNCLDLESLVQWIIINFNSKDTILEITGGEPTLVKWLNEFIEIICSHGYRVILKTNGSSNISKRKGLTIVSAWHMQRPFPKCYDVICIIKNPYDSWEIKEQLCKEKNIPYKLVEFCDIPHGENRDKKARGKLTVFKKMVHVNSSGQITMCSRIKPNEKKTIWNTFNLIDGETIRTPDNSCKNVYDVEVFL